MWNSDRSGIGNVLVEGGSGQDRITVSGALNTSITTGADSDTIVLTTCNIEQLKEIELLSNILKDIMVMESNMELILILMM